MRRQSSPMLPAILLLLLVNGLLGLVVYWVASSPDLFVRRLEVGGVEAPSGNAVSARPGSPASPDMPGEAAFAVISSRPLFAADRLPPEKPQAIVAGPVSSQSPPFVVTGIVGAGEDSVAILKDMSPGAQRDPGYVVRAGDTVKGWTVEAILADERKVAVVDGERRHELELVEDETGPARPGAPAVRPPVVRPPVVRPPQRQPQPQPQVQPPQDPQSTR